MCLSGFKKNLHKMDELIGEVNATIVSTGNVTQRGKDYIYTSSAAAAGLGRFRLKGARCHKTSHSRQAKFFNQLQRSCIINSDVY